MNIIIFFIILLILVLVHEFGHFFSAKKFGIRVDEFGFGFPPKLFGKKYGETEYTFNALPFGGFVKIFGENPDEESINGVDAGRSFVNQPRYKQAIVLVAGIVANLLLAWVLFSFTFMLGLPTSATGAEGKMLQDVHLMVISVADKSPAATAGLIAGDKIVSVQSGEDTLAYINPDTFKSFVVSHGEKEITIGYLRGDHAEQNSTQVTPIVKDGDAPMIGISMDQIGTEKLSIFGAFGAGARLTLNAAENTVVGLYTLIKGALTGTGSLSGVAGPVGMVGIVGDAYKLGFSYLLSFTALISINLAVINIIPFPALDGGRLFFLLIEKIKGSRINPTVANTANMVGFAILVIFMLVVTYHDVAKLL